MIKSTLTLAVLGCAAVPSYAAATSRTVVAGDTLNGSQTQIPGITRLEIPGGYTAPRAQEQPTCLLLGCAGIVLTIAGVPGHGTASDQRSMEINS